MKKIFNLTLFIFVMISFLFFKKIIQTDIGLISYFIICMLMLFLVYKQNLKKKDID